MAAPKKKRGADNYITDQNWNQEDEKEEEAGTFQQASEDIISKRTFKKAKRRAGNEVGEDKAANPFSAFAGFGNTPPNIGIKQTKVSPFETCTSDINKENKISQEAASFWKVTDGQNKDFFANRGESAPPISENQSPAQKHDTDIHLTSESKLDDHNTKTYKEEKMCTNNSDDDAYFQQLISLNVSVLDWIKQHVEKNPCIDLTPVFNDYEKHLKQLSTKDDGPKQKSTDPSQVVDVNANLFKTPDSSNASPVAPMSSVATTKASSVFTSSTPIQNNGVFHAPVSKFAGSTSFAASPLPSKVEEVKKEETSQVANGNDDESQPNPARKTIVEKDAFYQIRCKLFFKKGVQWQELGIGMLYLKPNGEKTQLLIRMETATGKILLNISISSEMPISRSGKNNVMIVSIPNPPVYSKPADGDNNIPCTYLIRVKGTPEADELFSKLKAK